MINPELEYNLSGALLATIREKDFSWLQRTLVESGFKNGCLFPFRALAEAGEIEDLRRGPLKIVHLEQPWNPADQESLLLASFAGIMGYAKRMIGARPPYPILQDALFPGKATCERLFEELILAFPQAKVVSYDVDYNFANDRLIMGFNGRTEEDLLRFLDRTAQRGVAIFFDPHNLTEGSFSVSYPNQPAKEMKYNWQNQFNIMAETGRLETVDIHGGNTGLLKVRHEEVEELKRGKGFLFEVAQAAKEISSVKYLRVEIMVPPLRQIPGLTAQRYISPFFKEIAQALKAA